MRRRIFRNAVRWGLCLAVALVTTAGHVDVALAADENESAPTHAQSSDAEHDQHAGHNEFDLSHSNAGPKQEDPVDIQKDLAFWTLVVFCLVFLILAKFAWGPIRNALDKREQSIADQIAAAQQSNEEAKQLLAQHEKRLAGAAEEIRAMLDQARKDADAQKQQILDTAQSAAAAQKDRALREIDAATNVALQQLAQRSVDTAVNLAGQIVQRQLKADDHSQLIQDALNQFPSEN